MSTSSSSSAMTSTLCLPELLAPIGSYLDPPNLLQCVQVSQLWNQVLIPALWRTIDDTRHYWPKIIEDVAADTRTGQGEKEEQLRDIYAKYGRHIRDFRSSRYIPIVAIQAASSCVHLRSLAIYRRNTYGFQEAQRLQELLGHCRSSDEVEECLSRTMLSPVFEGAILPSIYSLKAKWWSERCIYTQRFWLLVLQNPMLEELRLGKNVESMLLTLQGGFASRTLASLPRLTRLDNSLDNEALPLSTVLGQLPQIQHYASCLNYFVVPVFDRTFPQTRSIHSSAILKLPDLFSLLDYLSNLEQLWVKGFNLQVGTTIQSLSNTMDTATYCLLGLHITDETLSHAEEMDSLLVEMVLPRVPHLTTLSHKTLCSKTAAALGTHCPSLQSFQLLDVDGVLQPRDIGPFKTNVVGTLLRHCRDLKVLDAADHSIETDYLLAEPWVCRGLETFRCQLTGMNRLTGKEKDIYDTWPAKECMEDKREQEEEEEERDAIKAMKVVEKQRRCQELHGRVFSQLAEMAQLRVLDLGGEVRDPFEILEDDPAFTVIDGRLYSQCSPPIANTLELSLQSGLGRLSALKKLEVFGFEGVDHRIGTEELAWMAESWPRLRIMRGLHGPLPFALVAVDPKTRMLRRYMEELRPFVKHQAVEEVHPMTPRHESLWSALAC